MIDLRSLTLKHLRAHEATARLGSVTEAARELNVTPPAITAQLKSLRELIATELYDRANGTLDVTPAGQVMIDTALDIERLLALARLKLSALQSGASGFVVLAAVSTAKYIVPRVVARFEAEHPEIRVRLVVGNRRDILRGLEANEYDILLTGRPPKHVPIDTALLCDHPHILIASPDSPLARRRSISVADLAGQRLLSREIGSGTRLVMESFLARSPELVDLEVTELDSNETIKQAVMADLGIAVISAHTCLFELETKKLVSLAVTGFPIVRQWYLINRSDAPLAPAARVFKSFLLDRRAELFPDAAHLARQRRTPSAVRGNTRPRRDRPGSTRRPTHGG